LKPWFVVVALAVLLHALLLGVVPLGLPGSEARDPPRTLQVRRIVLPAPEVPAAAEAAAPQPDRPRPPPPAAAAARRAPAVAVGEARRVTEAAAPSAGVVAVPEAAAAAPPAVAEAAAAAVPEGDQLPPVFATQLPPAAVARYELRRGGLVGESELAWRPSADGYVAVMQGSAFGLPIVAWASQGGFDSAGLAPERFVDRRRNRGARAANFDRAAQRITFSGAPVQYPLPPGAQDRLSWAIQLAAIVQADPARFGPGERIPIFVAGARGDADTWTFVVEAGEAIELPAGKADKLLRLRREARRPFDTTVEVWLDPARHHFPVKLRFSTAQASDWMEFRLMQLSIGGS
jgi:hypothetical protein